MRRTICLRACFRRLKGFSNVELKQFSSSMLQLLLVCFGELLSFPWTKLSYQRLGWLVRAHVMSWRRWSLQNSFRFNTEARHQTKQIPFGHLSALAISSAIESTCLLPKRNETSIPFTKVVTWSNRPTCFQQTSNRLTKIQMKRKTARSASTQQ